MRCKGLETWFGGGEGEGASERGGVVEGGGVMVRRGVVNRVSTISLRFALAGEDR